MSSRRMLISSLCLLGIGGCQSIEKASVVAVTGTVVGLEVSSGSTTGPELVLGYNRAEAAVVSEKILKDGAAKEDIANVVMELHYSNAGSNAGIYQRLAVGKEAVGGLGAAVMFAKKADGSVDTDAVEAINEAFSQTSSDEGFDEVIVIEEPAPLPVAPPQEE